MRTPRPARVRSERVRAACVPWVVCACVQRRGPRRVRAWVGRGESWRRANALRAWMVSCAAPTRISDLYGSREPAKPKEIACCFVFRFHACVRWRLRPFSTITKKRSSSWPDHSTKLQATKAPIVPARFDRTNAEMKLNAQAIASLPLDRAEPEAPLDPASMGGRPTAYRRSLQQRSDRMGSSLAAGPLLRPQRPEAAPWAAP